LYFQKLTLGLVPSQFLTPADQFRKAGWNQLIYDSAEVPPGGSIAVFGAFKGDSVSQWIESSPGVEVFAYEPVPEYFHELCKKFSGQRVKVYNFGVSDKNEFRIFNVGDVFSTGNEWRAENLDGQVFAQQIRVNFRSLEHAVDSWPPFIDVLEINIEGGEYELLEIFAKAGILARVRQVFVQFHDVGPTTSEEIRKARQYLESTHVQVWSFEMVWESWKSRSLGVE
jgi:FkbM family methyltransferase